MCSIILFVGRKFIVGLLVLIFEQIKTFVTFVLKNFLAITTATANWFKKVFWSVGKKCCKKRMDLLEKFFD